MGFSNRMDVLIQAQQHRTFISTVQKQANLGCAKPLYSLNGRTSLQHNGLTPEETVDEEEGDDEVRQDDMHRPWRKPMHTVFYVFC